MEIIFEKVTCQELHDLSFTISAASIVGITGHGKSKFLRMLNSMEKIEGSARFGDLCSLSEIRKKVNLVEQKFENQFFLQTVEEHIVFLMKYYKLDIKDPYEKVISVLKMVGLTEDYLKKELSSLASSEQKLLQIAIALLSNPEVILLDEPFVGLDIHSQKKLKRLLEKLKERYHKTLVIASHDSNLLYEMTDTMIYLKNGTIQKQGDTTKCYQDVKFLMRHHFEIPDLVLFTYKAKTDKKIKLDYHKDIRDLIKDVYKHV